MSNPFDNPFETDQERGQARDNHPQLENHNRNFSNHSQNIQPAQSSGQYGQQPYRSASPEFSKSAREAELDQRERMLIEREGRLSDREKAIGNYHPPNFPRFKPMVYMDIENDIPKEGKWLVKRIYQAWWLNEFTYLLNVCACLALLIIKAEGAGGNFGLSLIYFFVGTPVSFSFWYMSLYNGVKHDRSVNFFLFFFNYACHLVVSAAISIGMPGWGGAGVIYSLSAFGTDAAVGILSSVTSAFLIFEVVYGMWQIKAAIGYYKGRGMSVEKAQNEAASGIAASGVGRGIAKNAVKSQLR